MCVNICMRVSPSCEQLIADSLNWSEQLRTASLAGCDDVLGFVAKICKMPSFMSTARGDVPISTVTKMCNDWGLRWQGKAIERNTWTHMQCIMPFAGDEAVITAIDWRNQEDVARSRQTNSCWEGVQDSVLFHQGVASSLKSSRIFAQPFWLCDMR